MQKEYIGNLKSLQQCRLSKLDSIEKLYIDNTAVETLNLPILPDALKTIYITKCPNIGTLDLSTLPDTIEAINIIDSSYLNGIISAQNWQDRVDTAWDPPDEYAEAYYKHDSKGRITGDIIDNTIHDTTNAIKLIDCPNLCLNLASHHRGKVTQYVKDRVRILDPHSKKIYEDSSEDLDQDLRDLIERLNRVISDCTKQDSYLNGVTITIYSDKQLYSFCIDDSGNSTVNEIAQ